MTKALDEAIEALRSLPPDRQDVVAPAVMVLARGIYPAFELSADEKADLEAGLAEIERGEIATDEEVRAIWAKHGL
jgi:predicted transcriptional regulator